MLPPVKPSGRLEISSRMMVASARLTMPKYTPRSRRVGANSSAISRPTTLAAASDGRMGQPSTL